MWPNTATNTHRKRHGDATARARLKLTTRRIGDARALAGPHAAMMLGDLGAESSIPRLSTNIRGFDAPP